MKIIKELKHARFTWDEAHGIFSVEQPQGNKIELNKVYSFALMRFIIRISQKNFLRKPLSKEERRSIIEELQKEEQEEEHDDPRQKKFDF
tara:strand:- start:185 stop:454 length:270 start_codon:yes stop_codon:yes gene_type:complete